MKRHCFFRTLVAGMLAAVAVGAFSAFRPGKVMKGAFHPDSGIFGMKAGETCRIDSAAGDLLYIAQAHENPLFESQEENRVHLMLWWPGGVRPGTRYTLPSPEVRLCYREQGDLLMFHTFKGSGSVQFGETEGKWVTGEMDLKLVEPHHNMSNSDYHYMGGRFRLKRTD